MSASTGSYTQAQLVYLAQWITRSGPSATTLVNTAAQSRVDLNPHQVEAALFALRGTERSSVFSNGVLLADEVGLGKTIEAGLVLAQHWAAKKKRLLLVVPASLRKQWQQELLDKFLLESEIVDGQTARLVRGNVFEHQKIVIVSYEFASKRHEELAQIDWQLVVMDEAHRLRNLHKDGQRAANLLAALGQRRKILLTATPFQNSLSELWSLVHFLDQDYLGDLGSFDLQYRGRRDDDHKLRELSARLAPICQRTLRRQVAADGQISFTKRYAITLDFSPHPDERQLYDQVSAWLQNPDSIAFDIKSRHLVTLVIRKILASSSYAIATTLEKSIERLAANQSISLADALIQETTLDSELDAYSKSELVSAREKVQAELSAVRSYHELAKGITTNAKGEALLEALGRAFESNEKLAGSARKAVVFTESVRTQNYLQGLLSDHGYAGKIVLLNGNNSDPASQHIYRDWMQKHQGSAQISGSKNADMKAAIVAAFRDQAEIMIATESGAEGINLQFCQILVNYDLPWNPQRIEQRIGRVHRYGQKCDVIVVNFVNTTNQVDRQVHNLLHTKLKLFDGVFGASDEILGALESGLDLEREINNILEQRRGEDEIAAGFAELQQRLDGTLRVTEAQTREKVLANFDTDVVDRLRDRRQNTKLGLDERQLHWQAFAAGALGAQTAHQTISLAQTHYALDWEQAQLANIELIRADLEPFQERLEYWRGQKVQDCQLRFHYQKCAQKFSDLEAYLGQSGFLHCRKVSTQSMDEGEYLLVAATNADGAALDPQTAQRLLLVPATILALLPAERTLQPSLAREIEAEQAKLDASLDYKNRQWFDQENDRLERWGDDQNAALTLKIKEFDQHIKDQRKAMRAVDDFKTRVELKRELAMLEQKRDAALADFYLKKKEIAEKIESLIDHAEHLLSKQNTIEALFTLEWELTP
jgi:ERCC4-related helicase